MKRIFVLALVVVAVCAVHAQDMRTVTEPVIPAACATLDAALTIAGPGHSGMTLAAADEGKLDTERIQKAIDHCGKGKGVLLQSKGAANAFLSGPLELREGVTLIVDKGTTLFASRDAKLFEVSPGSCGLVDNKKSGCKPLIRVSHAKDAGVMGDGTIDGRGGEKVLGKGKSWWELAEDSRESGNQEAFRLIVADGSDNFTIYRITLKNSPNFHVTFSHGNGFTVWGLKIDTPQRLARNTDGVDPGNGAKNITITQSYLREGDDNVALKGGGDGITNVSIMHNHFYWGHGMSIGSETNGGVNRIYVSDLSLDGPDNGIRIKSNGSRGGLTQNVVYDDVCVRNSPNPITLDTGYTAAGTPTGDSPPTMKDVTLHNVRVAGGGKFSFNGYDKTHRIGVNLDNVLISDTASYKYAVHHADIKLGPGPVNLQFAGGEDSTLTGKSSNGTPASCAAKFVPFPEAGK